MKTITTEGLKTLQGQNRSLALINTLAADEFEKTKIPGATNIPQASSDFAARVEQAAGGKNMPVVVYCGSQQCNSSEKAAQKLEAAGFTAVSRYAGGAEAWRQESEKVHAGQCG